MALHEFLVRLCLECSPPRYTTLHYLIQYHVIEASRVIARMLLQGATLFMQRVLTCPSSSLTSS